MTILTGGRNESRAQVLNIVSSSRCVTTPNYWELLLVNPPKLITAPSRRWCQQTLVVGEDLLVQALVQDVQSGTGEREVG